MYELKAGSSEEKFAELIWKYEPITSGKLAFRAAELWGWSKTTSFTVLRRLCNKGLFQNNKGSHERNVPPVRANALWKRTSAALCLPL